MNRRQSLLSLSALAGHALFSQVLDRAAAASALLARPDAAWQAVALTERQGRVLEEVVDTIIPDTDTPGARAARVHVFVDLMLEHCVSADDRKPVLAALEGVPDVFLQEGRAEREARLLRVDPKALALLKELTILGYFTSEVGARRALAYEPVPGEYRGCIDLEPGRRAWATR
jgi:hypothetical protein